MSLLISSEAINVAAYAFYEPQEPLMPFIPSWYNVWESHMLRLVAKKNGGTSWSFQRYGINYDMYLREGIRKTNCRPYLYAIENVVDQAFSCLDTQSQFQLKKERNGIIYIDAWGELTAFEQIDSLRDAFTLNIIPRNIIKKYSIKNFSCKIRGERNGMMSALLLAQKLINSSLLDNIFICGGFRAIPILSFSEIDRQPLAPFFKPKTLNHINSIERVACIIVSKKVRSDISIYINRYFSIDKNKRKEIKKLRSEWDELINENTKSIYTAALLTYRYISILEATLSILPSHINHYFLNRLYGDSGFITPVLMFDHLQKIGGSSSHHILSAFDGENGTWLLDCWKQ